ncbi:MAG TPA: hypothetical protein VK997_03990 [Deferrisomatales bacterium]|nr:hypothetical protein [Deferrisomatales bacterium]
MSRPVQLGRAYRCNLCGARVMVIRAATQALEPHCCNQPMEPLKPLHKLYRCAVCGSEVAVLSGDNGPLELICCHQLMGERPAPVAEAA